jgi:hypothetical protein
MVRRTTWILLVLFAVLAVFAWWYQGYQAKSGETAATTTVTPLSTAAILLSVDPNQVNGITITSNTGDKLSLYRDAGTTNWGVKDVPIDKVDTERLASVISPLLTMQVLEILSQSPTLASVGLDLPAYTISIDTEKGQQEVIFIGIPNAIATGYYARLGTGPILILDKVILDDFLKLITEPPLLATATPEVTETVSGTSVAPEVQGTPTP